MKSDGDERLMKDVQVGEIKTILVVEDDEAIRYVVTELLKRSNFHVISVENGAEALDALSALLRLPNLILLDLMMPIMDGYQFSLKMRQIERIANIPIVVMSADSHVMEKQAQTEACAYVQKPIDIDHLLNTLTRYAS